MALRGPRCRVEVLWGGHAPFLSSNGGATLPRCRRGASARFERGAAASEILSDRAQAATDTRRKVAGMWVAPGLGLWFSASNSSSSRRPSSAARPVFAAASKAFIVGP
jgi:hypothetical protein